MRIGIIGQGRVGSALHTGWTKAGHDLRTAGRSTTPSIAEIATWAEVLVFAVPSAALEDAVGTIGEDTDRIVIDCTNPPVSRPAGSGRALGHSVSGAERLQTMLPKAKVVKTLNQVGAEVMTDTSGFPHPPVQFVAGDDETAKRTVSMLLADLGFEPLDAGGLAKAQMLETFAHFWINQAIAQNKGRAWAFGAMPRKASQ